VFMEEKLPSGSMLKMSSIFVSKKKNYSDNLITTDHIEGSFRLSKPSSSLANKAMERS
jgi:hypothetical protein